MQVEDLLTETMSDNDIIREFIEHANQYLGEDFEHTLNDSLIIANELDKRLRDFNPLSISIILGEGMKAMINSK